jgi:2-polyprenyl-6-methoxyphenol hydroxylase-like FAD-dependent oxidoreductase
MIKPKSCCIVGGGPAGMMLGYLLARRGVSVTVLEKHTDFLRDFRGDTVHPSTLIALQQIGLLQRFNELPQSRINRLSVRMGDVVQTVADFRGLAPFDYIALVPQWDLLNLLAEAAKQFPHFTLQMQHEATALLHDGDRVIGVNARTPNGEREFRADLIIACDGRGSTLRDSTSLTVEELGAPMDVLWFKLPKPPASNGELFGVIGAGTAIVLIDRNDYFQVAYILPKGSDMELRSAPLEKFRQTLASLVPELKDSTAAIQSWNDVKTLEVKVDRLKTWHQPGLLLIGDAAHAMSPIGGVGINLAIQDSIAAANVLAPVLAVGGEPNDALLSQVQRRRLPAVKKVQALQLALQNNALSAVLAAKGEAPKIPAPIRWLLKFRILRNIPARIIGYGFDREDVE